MRTATAEWACVGRLGGSSGVNTSPAVMVSSTFYDLRQIRADLAKFIGEDLGYRPLLSELPSFPVDPDLDTIENCRKRVDQNADILVLVIGGRYGSIDSKTTKSVTNLEFLEARKKGVPTYAFVEEAILTVLPVWKANPSADFSKVVDTPKLFEFVEYVRTQERVWSFSFRVADDIINILRIQLAYLFSDALAVRLKLAGKALPPFLGEIGPAALRIALERPQAWEYRLFLRCWIDEIERHYGELREYQAGLGLELAEFVPKEKGHDWFTTRLHELRGITEATDKMVNACLKEALQPPGEPADPQQLVWVAQMMGKLLEKVLGWVRRVRSANAEAPFDRVAPQLALFADDLISQLQDFPRETLSAIDDSIATAEATGEKRTVRFEMKIQLSNLDAFNKALEDAKSHLTGS